MSSTVKQSTRGLQLVISPLCGPSVLRKRREWKSAARESPWRRASPSVRGGAGRGPPGSKEVRAASGGESNAEPLGAWTTSPDLLGHGERGWRRWEEDEETTLERIVRAAGTVLVGMTRLQESPLAVLPSAR